MGKGASPRAGKGHGAKQVRTEGDKLRRALSMRYFRATGVRLPVKYAWMLSTQASFQKVSDAAAAVAHAEQHGLAPVEARVASSELSPDEAVLQLSGEAPSDMSGIPDIILYLRMCEFASLAVASQRQVSRIFDVLEESGFLKELPNHEPLPSHEEPLDDLLTRIDAHLNELPNHEPLPRHEESFDDLLARIDQHHAQVGATSRC